MRAASRSTSKDLLAQAGDRSDELAPMIETFLVRAPRRVASAQALAYVRTLDDPPILRARVAKALRVDDVVDAIVAACKIQPDARPKVRRYYQQLEGGVLDPAPVAASVWDAISALLGRSRESLTVPHVGIASSASPMYRADKLFEPGDMPALVRDSSSRSRPTRSTRSSSASLRRPERTRAPGTQPGGRPRSYCESRPHSRVRAAPLHRAVVPVLLVRRRVTCTTASA